ncbi:MAG: PH domain-containing protein [Planctomycetota bacterium]|jgi:membrane protein YdbS with pleckstrin-like domain
MESIVLKPEKEQRIMWFIGWAITFVIGLTVWIVLLLLVDTVAFSLCIVGWLILASLFLLWIPAFYKSLEYVIDSDSVKMNKGVFWKKRVTVPFTKITNLDVTQGPVQRAFDIGTIHVQTAGAGGPEGARAELKLLGVRDLDQVKDTIMERVRGYTILKPDEVKQKVAEQSDSEIFARMLKELTAIRDVLEKKGNR